MPPSGNENDKIERLRRAMYSRTYADKLGGRPRRELGEEQSGVPEDWKHEEPRGRVDSGLPLEAMLIPKERKSYSVLKLILLGSAVFFVAAMLFFVYYLFFGGASSISARNIDIAITGPAEIAGGEPVNLQVTLTNHNREALSSAQLVVTYPSGTRLDPSSCSVDTCTIQLGSIEAGATDAIKLPAIYQGQMGDHANVHIELRYQLGGSNAIFTDPADYAFVFSSAPLSIAVQGNTETISGQQMQLTLNVLSNATQPIPDVLLSAQLPFGFVVSSSDPGRAADGLWHLGTIGPGEHKVVTINGTLSGETGDNRTFQFSAGQNMNATSTGIDTPLAQTELPITIAQPFLELSLTVNDSSGASVVVAPGSLVNVRVAYKNNLSTAIDNAVVVAKLSGITINGVSVQSADGFYRSTDNAVLWDKTTTQGKLAHLDAGASGELSFAFQVPPSTDLASVQNPVLVMSVNAAGERLGQSGVPENLQSTVLKKIAVASDLQIRANGLYFTNPFGVTGHMPPKPGIETAYAIVFSITNSTNAIKNARVSAQLPPYVRLIGNHYLPSSEKVGFNGNNGSFTWDVGDIVAGAGVGGTPPRQVVIEIGFTPSTSQIGTTPVLVQEVQLTGIDTSTGENVTKKAQDVNTNITGDPGFSSNQATVCSESNCPN